MASLFSTERYSAKQWLSFSLKSSRGKNCVHNVTSWTLSTCRFFYFLKCSWIMIVILMCYVDFFLLKPQVGCSLSDSCFCYIFWSFLLLLFFKSFFSLDLLSLISMCHYMFYLINSGMLCNSLCCFVVCFFLWGMFASPEKFYSNFVSFLIVAFYGCWILLLLFMIMCRIFLDQQ